MRLLQKLWNDERGAVMSIELVLIGSVVLLGLIVGLAAYRDSIVQELGDAGASVGSLDQSYAIEIQSNAADPDLTTQITEAGGLVTFRRDFHNGTDRVLVTATHRNYGYADNPDLCDAIPPNPQDPSGQPPAGIQFTDATGFDEGDSP